MKLTDLELEAVSWAVDSYQAKCDCWEGMHRAMVRAKRKIDRETRERRARAENRARQLAGLYTGGKS